MDLEPGELTGEERELFSIYRRFNELGRSDLLKIARGMTAIGRVCSSPEGAAEAAGRS